MIVAVFLVIGGFLSGISVIDSRTGVVEVAAGNRGAGFFISRAQGAENATMLLGARAPSPVVAVSDNSVLNPKLVFSTNLGAVKSAGAFAEYGVGSNNADITTQTSSRNL